MWIALLLTLFTQASQPAPADNPWTVVDDPVDAKLHFVVPQDPTYNEDGSIDILVHLKAPPAFVAERVGLGERRPMVVVVSDNGFSSVYTARFADPANANAMLMRALEIFAEQHDLEAPPTEGRLFITSFSAGYGGVRELLKHDDWQDRIDGLLMLDSIYAGFSDEQERVVDAGQMAGFCRFAQAAAEGEKSMILVHSRYTTPTYASTWETADTVLASLDLQAEPADQWLTDELHVYRTAERGRFKVVGTTADDGSDHGKILAAMNLWLDDLYAATEARETP